jgi:hypothetical protein
VKRAAYAGGFALADTGENTFGRATDNTVVMEHPTLPNHAGTFFLKDTSVEFNAAPNANIATTDGKPVTRLALVSDADGDPTVLKTGTLSFPLWRLEARFGHFNPTKKPVILNVLGFEEGMDRARSYLRWMGRLIVWTLCWNKALQITSSCSQTKQAVMKPTGPAVISTSIPLLLATRLSILTGPPVRHTRSAIS